MRSVAVALLILVAATAAFGTFASSTPIAVSAGQSRISDINVGDNVLALSGKTWSPQRVVFSSGTASGTNIMVYITYGSGSSPSTLIVSPDHVFLLSSGKLVTAQMLVPGAQQLMRHDLTPVPILTVSLGNYNGGIHDIATTYSPTNVTTDNHLIDSNGVVSGDFFLQLYFPNLPQTVTEPPFVRILAPFDTVTAPGAGGALWSAELRARNGGDMPVSLIPDMTVTVPPHTTQVVDFGAPPFSGIILTVPVERQNDVQFSLSIRDLHASDSDGTNVPLISIEKLRGSYVMTGVPISSAERRTLRVYDVQTPPQSLFHVQVFDDTDNRTLVDRTYTQSFPATSSPVIVPATLDFSDALNGPEVLSAAHVTVSIERTVPKEEPFWPMISTTGNADHRVKIFVPNL